MEQVQGVLHLVQQTNNNSDDVSSKACLKEDDLPSPTSGLLGNDSLVNNLHLTRGGEVYLGLKIGGMFGSWDILFDSSLSARGFDFRHFADMVMLSSGYRNWIYVIYIYPLDV